MSPKVETSRKPHILVLTASAGGGHRSVAAAITEALGLEFGDRVTCEVVDVIKEYAPAPLDKVPEAYQQMIKTPQLWKQFYDLGDGPRRTKFFTTSIALYARRRSQKLLDNHPCDLIVSVYHFANAPILDALKRKRSHVPYVTVVTDLVTTPPVWYDKRVNLCIVPTEAAKQRALEAGLPEEHIKVTGLPIADGFNQPPADPKQLRRKLGWPMDRTMILMMAGGEGIGPLMEICLAITQSDLPVGIAVVTGNNAQIKAQIEAIPWPLPVFVYGFVPQKQIQDFMQASDIYITKAGPTNITEAASSGLPMIIYGRLPGQEEGNVDYVVDEGAGVWAPLPSEIMKVIKRWTKHPNLRQAAADTSRSLANPQAARNVARILGEMVGLE